MQTYVFTVAVTGEDVQDIVEAMREVVIQTHDPRAVDLHVTEGVRVSPPSWGKPERVTP